MKLTASGATDAELQRWPDASLDETELTPRGLGVHTLSMVMGLRSVVHNRADIPCAPYPKNVLNFLGWFKSVLSIFPAILCSNSMEIFGLYFNSSLVSVIKVWH